jgi:hypothetical protein
MPESDPRPPAPVADPAEWLWLVRESTATCAPRGSETVMFFFSLLFDRGHACRLFLSVIG